MKSPDKPGFSQRMIIYEPLFEIQLIPEHVSGEDIKDRPGDSKPNKAGAERRLNLSEAGHFVEKLRQLCKTDDCRQNTAKRLANNAESDVHQE